MSENKDKSELIFRSASERDRYHAIIIALIKNPDSIQRFAGRGGDCPSMTDLADKLTLKIRNRTPDPMPRDWHISFL